MKDHRPTILLLVAFAALSAGQVTNPAFTGYTNVTEFTCANKPERLEVIHITDKCGTILSPCWPANYSFEITEGFYIWNFNVPSQIATRITLNVFETNGINGVAYFGRTVQMPVVGNNALGVTREYEMHGSLSAGSTGPTPFTFATGATSLAATVSGTTYEFDNTTSFFMSFFSSLEPTDRGFNISYCVDQNLCELSSPFCTSTNRGTCQRDGFDMYSCNCSPGFTGTSCETDINECAAPTSPCDPNADCTNTDGSFTCVCRSGYTGNGETCTDINECSSTDMNNCSLTGSSCTNTPGSFTCACLVGWTGDGVTCTDINECDTNNGGCGDVSRATCTNNMGSFVCGCVMGFTGAGNCMDVDECADAALNGCDTNANCTNAAGSFTCTCRNGYTGNGTFCADINECMTNPCDTNAMCTNSVGSFSCSCNTFYTGNGFPGNCRDINECTLMTDNCDTNAACTNAAGSPGFTCMCNSGWTGNGTTCVDINECTLNTHNCSLPRERCENTPGSFTCPCDSPAYRGTTGNCDGFFCAGNVDTQANCTVQGIFEWPTFWDGTANYGINEDVTWFFDFRANASVTAIRFTFIAINTELEQDYIICNDNPNYRNLTPTAIIITGRNNVVQNGTAPVSSSNFIGFNVTTNSFIINRDHVYCHFHSDRQNTFSGFQIRYTEETTICSASNDPCKNGASCVAGFTGYTCENCTGFTGINCDIDINECAAPIQHNCDGNATCMNNFGSFTCMCNADFTGNGTFCQPHLQVTDLSTPSAYNNVTGLVVMTVSFVVTARWRNDVNYIMNYNITLTDAAGNSMSVLTPSVDVWDFTMMFNVTAFTSYTVTVTEGTAGPRRGDAVITFVTGSTTVTSGSTFPRAPTILNVTATAERSNVTWIAPDETERGMTIRYQIGVVRSPESCSTFALVGDTRGCTETFYDFDPAVFMSTSLIITDLIQYRQYNFRVRARTTVGYGNWSSVAVAFTGNICPSIRERTSVAACPYTSGALLSDNFPSAYPNLARSNWQFNHTGLGAIRFRADIFITEQTQDFFDIGFGAFPAVITPPAGIDRTWSGNLTGMLPTATFDVATTGGLVWSRFETDAFITDRGFLIIYEIDINSCTSMPCTMGGTCTDATFDFTCNCPSLWGGKVCNTPLVTVSTVCSTSASDSFTVSWTNTRENDTALFSGYRVTYNAGSGDVVQTYDVTTSTMSFSGFAPYTEYTATVEVIAVSPATVPTTSTCTGFTGQAAPVAPTNVVVSAPASGESTVLDVSWTAPATLNGVLQRYTITYTSTDHGTFGEAVHTGSLNVTSGTTGQLTGLRAYRSYSVSVTATTGGGTGPASTAASAQTNQAAPSGPVRAVSATAGAQEVNITFQAPAVVTGVLRYDIRYYVTGDVANARTQPASGTFVTISGLTPATGYTIEITASTSGGAGPTSAATTFTTLEDIPGPVATPTTVADSTTQITVSWTPPSSPNGVITAYRVTWSPGSGDSGSLPATDRSFQINGLMTYTEYTITVFASTAIGENSGTAAAPQRTNQGVPLESVRNVVVTETANGITLTYDPPTVVTGVFTYVLEYRVAGSGAFTQSSSATSITGLTAYTEYDIQVTVSTGAGPGPVYSSTVRTAEDIPGNVALGTLTQSETSIAVAWSAPSMPNGVILGYRLQWSPGSSMSFNSTVRSYTITGLTPFTSYVVTVFAQTSVGENAGITQTVMTPEGVPDPPTVSVSLTPDNNITITIIPATPAKGTVLFNEITVSQDNAQCLALGDASCFVVTRVLDASATSLVLTGLPGSRTISVSARANTTAGFGTSNIVLIPNTNPTAPSDISNLVVTPINGTALEVNFTTGRPVQGPSNFTITATDIAGNTRQVVVIDSGLALAVSTTIAGLAAGTQYTVTVTQTTGAGSSPNAPAAVVPRPATLIAGAQPSVGGSTNLLGASSTQAFAIANPCLVVNTYFSSASGPVASVDVVVKEASAPATSTILSWAVAILQNPVPQYHAATIQCATQSGRKKRQLSSDNQFFVVGHDSSCTSSSSSPCNGPLPSDREFQVAFRADTNAPEGKSALTAYSAPVRTSATTGLQPGEIAAIVICSIVGFLLIILIIYFIYKRRRGAGTYEPKSGDDNGAFDDSRGQRYRVDPSVPASTAYSDQPAAAPEERLA